MCAYCSASDVYGMVSSLIAPNTSFSASTNPTANMVTHWMSSGCGILETKLSAYRYSVPIPRDTPAYDMLTELNATYAAAKCELSRAHATLQLGERTRGQVLMKQFEDDFKYLCSMDLTLAGATRSGIAGKLFAGGVTQASKDAESATTIPPSLRRHLYDVPGVIDRSGITSACDNNAIRNDY